MPSLVDIDPIVVEKKILDFLNAFSLFPYYLPFEKGMALYVNKFNSPLPKDVLCQMKLAQFWGRRFLVFVNAFSLFRYLHLLERAYPST